MNKAVSAFLSRHGFVKHTDIDTMVEALLFDMRQGLKGNTANMEKPATDGVYKGAGEAMIRTYLCPPTNIKAVTAGRSAIVIDAGGTNFRSCLVTFDGKGTPSINDLQKTKMPGVEKELSKEEFFAAIADNIEHLKDKADTIGFCFSYPAKITRDGDGVLIGFTKEVKAPEVVGCRIGESLLQALKKRGWQKTRSVRILNDTVAALLAGAAVPDDGCKYSSYIGLILGTGLNAAYIQGAAEEYDIERQIIVCETGGFADVCESDFDRDVDKNTTKPGVFLIEKQSSGGYLGHLCLSTIKSACKDGLFTPPFAEALSKIEEMTLIDADSFLHTPYGNGTLARLAASSATDEDYDALYQLLDAIMERSARNAAAILSAQVIQSGAGTNATKPVCILCNGSTYHKTHSVARRVEGCLEEALTQRRGLWWKMVSLDDDITLGTAIGGLIER